MKRQRQNEPERDIEYLPEYEVQRRYDSLVRLIQGRGFSKEKKVRLGKKQVRLLDRSLKDCLKKM